MTDGARRSDAESGGHAGTQRLDKWLWFARVVKSRTLAASLVTAGKVRVNTVKAAKPSQTVKPGDVVTSSIKKTVRVLRVKAAGERRGPATEAAALYEDLTPPSASPAIDGMSSGHAGPGLSGVRPAGLGRPTKRDRRTIDRLHGRE